MGVAMLNPTCAGFRSMLSDRQLDRFNPECRRELAAQHFSPPGRLLSAALSQAYPFEFPALPVSYGELPPRY